MFDRRISNQVVDFVMFAGGDGGGGGDSSVIIFVNGCGAVFANVCTREVAEREVRQEREEK
jgi:hypothetical protein